MRNRASRWTMVAAMLLGGIAFSATAAPAEAHSRKDIKKYHKKQAKYAKKQYKYAKKQQKYQEKQFRKQYKYDRRAIRKYHRGYGYSAPPYYSHRPARSFNFAFGYGR